MTHDDDVIDPRWPAIEAELRRQPRVEPAALDRVMAAVSATPMEPDILPIEGARTQRRSGSSTWVTRRTISLSPLQAVAAALILAIVAGWAGLRVAGTPGVEAAGTGSVLATPASGTNAARPVQFVFVSAEAQQVSLVGSFNDWDLTATPLRLSRDGVWSVEVPLAPGRHEYSFVVNGKQWVPDASAPRSRADELGISNSIVYVGQGS